MLEVSNEKDHGLFLLCELTVANFLLTYKSVSLEQLRQSGATPAGRSAQLEAAAAAELEAYQRGRGFSPLITAGELARLRLQLRAWSAWRCFVEQGSRSSAAALADLRAGMEAVRQLLQLEPGSPELLRQQAVHLEQQDCQQAAAAFRRALQAASDAKGQDCWACSALLCLTPPRACQRAAAAALLV
jgi:hypothetical protein